MSRNLAAAIVLVAVILIGCGGSGSDDSLGNAQPWCVFAGDYIDAVEELSSALRDGKTESESREVTDSYFDAKDTLEELELFDGASHRAVQEVYNAGRQLIAVLDVPERYEGRYEESRERMDKAKETIRHICAS